MDYASSTELVTDLITGIGGQFFVIFTAIMGLFGALLALGWGIARVRRYIHGKKA